MKEALCHRFYLSIAHLPLETNQSRRRHFFTEKKAQLCSRTREALGCIDFTQWVLTSISVPLVKACPWDEEATSFNKTEHPDRRLFSKLKIQGEIGCSENPSEGLGVRDDGGVHAKVDGWQSTIHTDRGVAEPQVPSI